MRDYAYSAPRRRRHTGRSGGYSILDQEWLHTLLFYILPFIVINGLIFFLVTTKPEYELTIGEAHDYQTTDIQLHINSFLPVKELNVTLDSEPVELTPLKKNSYTATISKNGVLEIYVKSFNGMVSNNYEHISILDDNPPAVDAYAIEDGVLTFTLVDSQSGIDFNSVYATDSMGVTVYPSSVNKTSGEITFNMDANGLTVFANDLSGNQSQTTFTPQSSAEDGEAGDSGLSVETQSAE